MLRSIDHGGSTQKSISLGNSTNLIRKPFLKTRQSGISQLTWHINHETHRILERYSQVEKIKESEAHGHGDTDADCQTLIAKTTQEMRIINYRLSKIVSGNSTHKELHLGITSEIDCMEDDLVLAKISFIGGKDVIRFNIDWPAVVPQKVRNELKVFISMKFRQPTEKNCELVVQAVSTRFFKTTY